MNTNTDTHWPLRAWLLALAGAIISYLIYLIVKTAGPSNAPDAYIRSALASFLAVGGFSFAFVVTREKIAWSGAFAVLAATVVALTIIFSGMPGSLQAAEPWRLVCALLTIAIAAPLFQAWRDVRVHGPLRVRDLPYAQVHRQAWTNVVLWHAAWIFVGLAWGLALLLAALFSLIGLHFLKLLLNGEVGAVLTGAALGGAIGILRDREQILGLLQRVVTTVLSVLAPVLAVGLLVFLIALPFTGLAPLWQATKSTTPILIGCVISALVLINAVIGDAPEDEATSTALRWSAVVLGAIMLPLGAIAGLSTGLRIHQYGLTPDRLWAVVFTAIACAYGLAYLVALVTARCGWAQRIRDANLRLAFILCGMALLLSTPLISFGALSTKDQLGRLASGRTRVEQFDWKALRFDFGPSGVAALRGLAKDGKTPAIRDAAAKALKSTSRYSSPIKDDASLDARLTILPAKVELPKDLRAVLKSYACGFEGRCVVLYRPGDSEAILTDGMRARIWRRDKAGWTQRNVAQRVDDAAARSKRIAAALARHQVEVRSVTRRQVFVGGEPVDDAFE